MDSSEEILILDDDVDVGDFIATAVRSTGLQCMLYSNAAEFLAALTPRTSLVMLDLMMPDVDGIEMLRRLGRLDYKGDIILMSGVSKRVLETAVEFAGSMQLSVIGDLEKPFRLKQLQEILQKRHGAKN